MEPITKDFLTTLLATSFGAFRIEMKEEFAKVRKEMDIRFNYLKEEMSEFKREMYDFKDDMNKFREETDRNFASLRETIHFVGEKVFDDHEDRIIRIEDSTI